MTPKPLRVTVAGSTAKKVSFLAAMADQDAKDVVAEAVDLLWEQKGQQVLESVKEISPVSHLLDEDDKQETAESEKTD